jgi:glutamine cyclotransferase
LEWTPIKHRKIADQHGFGRLLRAQSKSTAAPHSSGKLIGMFRVSRALLIFTWAAFWLTPFANAQASGHSDTYRIVHVYPHDPEAFTQGLVYVDGHLYESTGRNRKSSVRMIDLQTGRILQHYDLPAEYFGEGLTDWHSNLVQLTWTSGMGFVYDGSA